MTSTLSSPRVRPEANAAKFANVDWSLLAAVVTLVSLGMVAVFSATQADPDGALLSLGKQAGFLVIGSILLGIVAFVDYREIRNFLGLAVIVTIVVLIAVLTPLGSEIKGTQAWFVLGPVSVQPAEFAKLALVVTLSAIFTGRTGSIEPHRIAGALGILGLLAVLVLLEGETGSVFVYCAITLGIFLAAGVPARVMLLLLISGIAVVSVAFQTGLMPEYARERLTAFVDENADPRGAGYQQRQSVTTIGSGGITGKGILQGPQTQAGFLPEQETDFIFSSWGEETGFVGTSVIIALEGFVLWRILRNARLARDGFGTLICVGVFVMFLFQVFQNVGMNLKLMPITGVPLPFVSYGGSSLLTSLLAIGLVQSVAVHRHRGSPV
ncbi:MAG: FtsW/RodA/SpoVE family cell cycle protein [Acidimicrobiales bacterium]